MNVTFEILSFIFFLFFQKEFSSEIIFWEHKDDGWVTHACFGFEPLSVTSGKVLIQGREEISSWLRQEEAVISLWFTDQEETLRTFL